MSDVVYQSKDVTIEQTPERLVCTIRGGSHRHIILALIFAALPILFLTVSAIEAFLREYLSAHPRIGDILPGLGIAVVLGGLYMYVLFKLLCEERPANEIVIADSMVTVVTPDFFAQFHQFHLDDLVSSKLQPAYGGKVRLTILTRQFSRIKASHEHDKETLLPVVDILNQYVTQDRHHAFEVVLSSSEAPRPALPVDE